jgi:hypothetical protein
MSISHKQNGFFSQRAYNEFSRPATRNQAVEEKVFSLFQPDVLVPAQYMATTKSKTYRGPELRLMLAVLEDAVWCFQNGLFSKDRKKQGLSRDAEEWIMEEEADWLFSFDEICDALGLESGYLRKHLRYWKKDALDGRAYPMGRAGAPTAQNRKSAAREKRHRYLRAAGF